MKRNKDLYTSARRGLCAATLIAAVLSFTGSANAEAITSAHVHKNKGGTLNIKVATEVGGVTLPPGEYKVKAVKSPDGPVMEFVHLFDNFSVGDSGLPVHDQETVARVKFTEQGLSSPSKHTELMLASGTAEATGLEIRGNAVEYLFASAQMTVQSPSTVDEAKKQGQMNDGLGQ